MDKIEFHYEVDGDDFTNAGSASTDFKRKLKKMHITPAIVRRVAIAMYEGEINMVIHADGGYIDTEISQGEIVLRLCDRGPGIENVKKAMTEGYSTATDKVRELGFGAGMGLPNMKKSTDEMHIETQLGVGTTVEMKIYINQ
ncbi:ATP-binding protein [Eubacterium oxidoreducens]|uniref:Anti-sigma regulatory factor (Ser/Thr protein kinase) n=1 Tax=Eubacterium oxidoreducens TaxID=1732 RepID=A0A1G6BVE7_EUBOX|nr:ATP-binding protein [Eubacterium oxidoreducens]SDB24569.1 Anti-sigma regulatory factor (Ser/Thr protein kinase) [Eubacterium oxidoreducens]